MSDQGIIDQALGMLDRQNRRLIKVSSPLPEAYGLQLDSFDGEERLSQTFRFNLQLLSYNAHIPLKEMCGKPFQLEIETPTGTPRYISGYATHASSQGADEGMSVYSVVLSPWLYWLSLRTNSRIFQDQTPDAIIAQIFGEYGVLADYEFRLGNNLSEMSYCVQYRETDLQFVQRLIERFGLIYYFEQSVAGHKLVIVDSTLNLPQLEQQPSVRFHRAQVNETEDSITGWSGTRSMQPSSVSLKTFDYKQPGLDSTVTLRSVIDQGGDDGGKLEVYDFPGAYGYRGRDEGERSARQHLEMLEARSKQFTGQGNVRAMALGRWFTLEDHYDHERDPTDERQFLITGLQHAGRNNYRQGQQHAARYNNSFTCIRRYIPYRPAYDAAAPVIPGPQTATVVGPEGEEIFTDDLYRIKVRFHWDRDSIGDDKSSCWVRVSSLGAGQGHGFVRVPRVGEEVIIGFLEGDPDRPVVTGTLYNGKNGVPWPLPDQRTVSGFMSRSTNEGSSDNASWLLFDDRRGEELLDIHAEKTYQRSVEEDARVTVGGNALETVKGNKQVELAEGSYTLNVVEGSVAIKAPKGISLESGASAIRLGDEGVSITGPAINIHADGAVDIKGS